MAQKIKIGQVWKDLDKRHTYPDRLLLITGFECFRKKDLYKSIRVKTHASCICLNTGAMHNLLLQRFRANNRGYELVSDTPEKVLAPKFRRKRVTR